MNARFPEVSLDLVGNYRHIDIAPQEIVTLTLLAGDTFRGLTWEQKAFTPVSMNWEFSEEENQLLPSVTLREVTQGNAGQTIAIPVTPPDDGFEQPPIQLPPPIPPIPVPPLDWGGGGYYFFPFLGGEDFLGNRQTWGYHASGLAGIDMDPGDGGKAYGVGFVPDGATQAICTPVIANNTSAGTVATYFEVFTYLYGSIGSDYYESNFDDYTYTATDLNWLTDAHTLTITVATGAILLFVVEINDPNDLAVWGVSVLFS